MILEDLSVGLWPSTRGGAVSPEDTRGPGELQHSDGQRLAGTHTDGSPLAPGSLHFPPH